MIYLPCISVHFYYSTRVFFRNRKTRIQSSQYMYNNLFIFLIIFFVYDLVDFVREIVAKLVNVEYVEMYL